MSVCDVDNWSGLLSDIANGKVFPEQAKAAEKELQKHLFALNKSHLDKALPPNAISIPILTEVALREIIKVKAFCLVMTRLENVDLIKTNIEKSIGEEKNSHNMSCSQSKIDWEWKNHLLLTQVCLLQNENSVFVGRFSCRNSSLRRLRVRIIRQEVIWQPNRGSSARSVKTGCKTALVSRISRLTRRVSIIRSEERLPVCTSPDPRNGSEIGVSYRQRHCWRLMKRIQRWGF